jgi:hypothetical protein
LHASPTQYKATQLGVALAVWATQRSDPDFTEATPTLFLPAATSLAYHDRCCYRKEKKEIKQRKKRKIWGGGCFGERPHSKITTSLFGFLANDSAALLQLGQPAARVFMTHFQK